VADVLQAYLSMTEEATLLQLLPKLISHILHLHLLCNAIVTTSRKPCIIWTAHLADQWQTKFVNKQSFKTHQKRESVDVTSAHTKLPPAVLHTAVDMGNVSASHTQYKHVSLHVLVACGIGKPIRDRGYLVAGQLLCQPLYHTLGMPCQGWEPHPWQGC